VGGRDRLTHRRLDVPFEQDVAVRLPHVMAVTIGVTTAGNTGLSLAEFEWPTIFPWRRRQMALRFLGPGACDDQWLRAPDADHVIDAAFDVAHHVNNLLRALRGETLRRSDRA